jgi:hypothetical protein
VDLGCYDVRIRLRGDSSHPMKTRSQRKEEEANKAPEPAAIANFEVASKLMKDEEPKTEATPVESATPCCNPDLDGGTS